MASYPHHCLSMYCGKTGGKACAACRDSADKYTYEKARLDSSAYAREWMAEYESAKQTTTTKG